MVISRKAALSLLISVVLIAVFSVLAFTGFFNLIETRFYNPSIANSISKEVLRDADTIEYFFDELESRFFTILENDVIKRSFLPTQAARDIFERTRLYGMLLESERGLQSVRFVDAGGVRIHYSTNQADILTQSTEAISYKNYDELVPFVPYGDLAVPDKGEPKIILDEQNDRIVFSFPFYDALDVYRGTAMYSLSVRAVEDRLVSQGRIKINEKASVISVPPGIVLGLPHIGTDIILPVISSVWQQGNLALANLDSGGSEAALALVSAKTSRDLFIGRVVGESLFAFPQAMKLILLTALFLTVFLTVFLVFNIQPDPITIMQNRLKELQLVLIRDYYERKGEMDWTRWLEELEQRREDIHAELKRGISEKESPAVLQDIELLIDKSWDEILSALGGKRETRLAIDEDKLQNILNRMIAAGSAPQALESLAPASFPVSPSANYDPHLDVTSSQSIMEEEPEELEELEELEAVEDDEIAEPKAEGAAATEEPEWETSVDIKNTFKGLDELDELDELKEISRLTLPAKIPESRLKSGAPAKSHSIGKGGLLKAASRIGLNKKTKPKKEDIELDLVMEIASPLAALESKIKTGESIIADARAIAKETKTSEKLEELGSDYSMSLVYEPFQTDSDNEIQELSSIGDDAIMEKDGINYVDKKVKTPDPDEAKNLDPNFKNLVDSVIGER